MTGAGPLDSVAEGNVVLARCSEVKILSPEASPRIQRTDHRAPLAITNAIVETMVRHIDISIMLGEAWRMIRELRGDRLGGTAASAGSC